MSSTDDRIVKMQFDNAQFKRGAAETKQSLADVNKAIDTAGKSKGLLSMSSAMQKVQVTASKMSIVTTTALATITNKAVNAGLALAKSLTFDPIKQGFQEYEALLTKQNVIQNATGKSAKVVKGVLNSLNAYSDKTIYNFGNMTDALQKFVNAGVSLKTATTTIKGIANAAAFAGASSEEANRAMYAFSQSMSLGFIQLQDWNQIENANLGTVKFKNELLNAAAAVGTLTKKGDQFIAKNGDVITATKGWRDGLKQQWATTEVLNKALGKYADTSTKLGKQAFKSAQEVRTFSAFMSTLKEALGSGWSAIFTSLIGNLKQSTKFWTGLSNAIGGAVGKFFDWLSTSLKVWRQMGGFEKTLEGFKNLLAPIGAILDVLGASFRAAFPDSGAGSGKALYGLSAGFAAITSPLQLLADLIRKLTGPMTIFFQVLRIAGETVGWVVGYIWDLVEAAAGLVDLKAPDTGGLMGWIVDLGEVIGDTLDQITKLLNKGKSIPEAFGSIDLPSLPSLPNISNPFKGGGGDASGVGDGAQKASASIGGMTIPLEGLMNILKKVGDFFKSFADVSKDAGGDVASAGEVMGNVIKKVYDVVSNFIQGISLDDIVQSFNMALLTTFIISMARILNTLSKSFQGFMQIGPGIGNVLNSASGALDSFQKNAAAKRILFYGLAILSLAAALWILSKIPIATLVLRLAVLAALFKLMSSAMKQLSDAVEKMDKKGSAGRMIAFSVAVVALAFAMGLLAGALVIFNYVDWSSVVKGIGTMAVMMLLMKDIGKLGKGSGPAMLGAAVGFMAIGQAMVILAGALMLFDLVKPEAMVKAGAALLAVTVALGTLGALMKGAWGAAALAAAGAAMIGAATGMNILATALLLFEHVSWDAMKKAGVALAGLAIGLTLMIAAAPAGIVLPLIGLGLIAIATGLLVLGKAEWSSIGKLVLLMGAMAVGLLILTPALYLAAPALVLFGVGMLALGTGLFLATTAITAAMLIFAGGATVISAFAISAALAFAAFLQTLALQAPVMKKAVLDILQAFIDTIVEAVPMVIQGVKDLWAALMKEFGGEDKKGGLKKAGSGATTSFSDGIIAKIPGIVRTGVKIVLAFLEGLKSRAQELSASAATLIVKLINGLASKAKDLVDAGVNLVIKLADGLQDGLNKLVNAGVTLLADFLHKLADTIRNKSGQVGNGIVDVLSAIKDVGVQMVEGLIQGVIAKGQDAIDAIVGLGGDMVDGLLHKLKIKSPSRVFMAIGNFLVQGLTLGIQNNAANAITAVASMVGGQIAVANEYINGFIQKLDQRAIAARAKADGLAAAAEKAQKAANKTKTKTDDRAADALGDRAQAAEKKAKQAEKKAEAAKASEDRKEKFKNASTLEKAKMRSEDAQRELDAAKAAERRAQAALVEADALDKQSRAKGVTAEQRRKMQAEADALRKQAKRDALLANKNLQDAKKATADALAYQKKAGDEAAAAFQASFDADAKAAADQAEFEKLSDQEKAALRRKQAAELQAKALKDLEDAKKLAYTDIQAANDLAALAQAEADRARQYLNDAMQLEGGSGAGGNLGTVVNLDPTAAAALAMSDYGDLYSSATAAAAANRTVEFNQYNTSPESLSPSEIYRQTNNLFAHAVDQLEDATAA